VLYLLLLFLYPSYIHCLFILVFFPFVILFGHEKIFQKNNVIIINILFIIILSYMSFNPTKNTIVF
ncbi:hypothetical protein GLOIN_2v1733413, partial [Rhizophagus irregularis DAOM 181602=DAOM 197198]